MNIKLNVKSMLIGIAGMMFVNGLLLHFRKKKYLENVNKVMKMI